MIPYFSDIGDLPSGYFYYNFDSLRIRAWKIAEVPLLSKGMQTNNLTHILEAVNNVITANVYDLTDGDFEFVLAWLKLHSFTKTPLSVNWTCTKENLVNEDGSIYKGPTLTQMQLKAKHITNQVCNTDNVRLVYDYNTIISSVDDYDNGVKELKQLNLSIPTVSTLKEYLTIVEKEPHLQDIAYAARFLKEGPLTDNIATLQSLPVRDYQQIISLKNKVYHGIKEKFSIVCRSCEHVEHITSNIDVFNYLSNITEDTILNMQYKLLNTVGMQPNNELSIKALSFFHSSLLKDEQEEAAKKK